MPQLVFRAVLSSVEDNPIGQSLFLSGAIVRLGRKGLIDTEAFGFWVETHRVR